MCQAVDEVEDALTKLKRDPWARAAGADVTEEGVAVVVEGWVFESLRGHQCNGSRLIAVVKVISEKLSFDSLIYFNMSDNINTDENG